MNPVQFDSTPSGLMRATISTPLANGEIYLQGAHITQWTPSGHRPVLFMSPRSFFEPGKAIRGGVPIIFPWFGNRCDGKPGPAHGFARSAVWTFESSRVRDDGAVEIVLILQPAEMAATVRFTAAFGTTLDMALEVSNTGLTPLRFEEALHTYFAISDIHDVAIHGLEGTTYIDKTDGLSRKVQPAEPIRIGKETDQVHVNTTSTCIIEDPAWQRRIQIDKTGSQSTVVWNPWSAKTAGMADMEANGWPGLVCIETANAADNAVALAAGESHRMTASISLR